MTRYISLCALFAIISFHQTGCTMEDPEYTDQSAALEAHEVSSPAEPQSLATELAPSESSDIGTESGTWVRVGAESCFDVCMSSCSACGFTPRCPANAGSGRSCPTVGVLCWHFTSNSLSAQELECR